MMAFFESEAGSALEDTMDVVSLRCCMKVSRYKVSDIERFAYSQAARR